MRPRPYWTTLCGNSVKFTPCSNWSRTWHCFLVAKPNILSVFVKTPIWILLQFKKSQLFSMLLVLFSVCCNEYHSLEKVLLLMPQWVICMTTILWLISASHWETVLINILCLHCASHPLKSDSPPYFFISMTVAWWNMQITFLDVHVISKDLLTCDSTRGKGRG